MPHPDDFLFLTLPTSANGNAFIEWLVACLPLVFPYHLSSPTSLLLSEASLLPLQVTLTHFTLSSYERVLRLPTSFSTSGLDSLKMKPKLYKFFWRVLRPLSPSCFLLLLLGRFSLFALPLLLEPAFLHYGIHFFLSLIRLRSPSLSRQGAALAHLDSLLSHKW